MLNRYLITACLFNGSFGHSTHQRHRHFPLSTANTSFVLWNSHRQIEVVLWQQRLLPVEIWHRDVCCVTANGVCLYADFSACCCIAQRQTSIRKTSTRPKKALLCDQTSLSTLFILVCINSASGPLFSTICTQCIEVLWKIIG